MLKTMEKQHATPRLRFYRKARGLSYKKLGALVDRSGEALRLIELGRRTGRPATWQRLAQALGVPVEILRGR